MLTLLYLLLSLSHFPDGPASVSTGIYMTIDCRKDMTRHREMLGTRMVCITQSPIMQPKDFAAIGPVREAPTQVYFDLKFTPKGHETLIKLTANLPESHLAVVVGDEVFYVFKASDLKVAPTLRFQTALANRTAMESVQRQLVDAKEAADKEL